MRMSETACWLADRGLYERAMFFCKKSKRQLEWIEVADLFASSLWQQGLHKKAVDEWASVVLPFAPSSYWIAFVERLQEVRRAQRRRACCARVTRAREQTGMLHFIEPHLPFNNPELLRPTHYLAVLEHRLRRGDYRELYELVRTWRPIYPWNAAVHAVVRVRVSSRLRG